ncbi:hypothetical protein CEXT_116321 [Caerostris extrusa]|uniref:Uncharacterized protein n=1 Tax=Caerostris extrusa TaxID=172846 RepID=A0AAV4WTX7_CAEEX|nr:hypothetical protein CEXT_116321 [Caerostris extrusa]
MAPFCLTDYPTVILNGSNFWDFIIKLSIRNFIVARGVPTLREALSSLEVAGNHVGLAVIDSKPKYMPVLKTPSSDTFNHLKIRLHEFETVTCFNYLGSFIKQKRHYFCNMCICISLVNKRSLDLVLY